MYGLTRSDNNSAPQAQSRLVSWVAGASARRTPQSRYQCMGLRPDIGGIRNGKRRAQCTSGETYDDTRPKPTKESKCALLSGNLHHAVKHAGVARGGLHGQARSHKLQWVGKVPPKSSSIYKSSQRSGEKQAEEDMSSAVMPAMPPAMTLSHGSSSVRPVCGSQNSAASSL